MFKSLFILLFLAFVFIACGTTVIVGATPQQIKQLPAVMVANSNISCKHNYGTYYIKKGTVFSIKKIGKTKFKTRTNLPFGVSDMLSRYIFPDNALFLPFQSDIGKTEDNGLIIYPNGKFIYEDNYGAAYDSTGGNWWLHKGKCNYSGEFPFELMDYR